MPYKALKHLLALAGLPEDRAGACQISGEDPVLKTRFRVGELAAGAQAAIGVVVSDLWQLRGGAPQDIAVDLRRAAISLRGSYYSSLNGKLLKENNPVHGFYPARDGRWIFLHCNFENLRAAALSVLGVPADRAKVEEACRNWDAAALEEAVYQAKGCGGFVRTPEEWLAHPQAPVVLPPLEIERIGDAPAEPLPVGDRPLSGIRVLDLTRVIAGPIGARSLAEHGAEVLRINRPDLANSGLRELDTGLGKRSAFLDLRAADQAETLRGLVRSGDVFLQAYRPGSLANRGFSAEALAALRPGIIYVELSAWGQRGPWGFRRGYDSVVQTVTGMATPQEPGGAPVPIPGAAMDYITGYLLAYGTMVALARRAREGGSWRVRASLLGSGKWILDQGIVDPDRLRAVPSEPDVTGLCDEMEAPDGRVGFFKPVLELSQTPPYWATPPVQLGTHPPAWVGERRYA